MSEIRLDIKMYEIDMVCDECGEGVMRPVGNIVLDTFPIQYPHRCTKCGSGENYTVTYPYQECKRIIPLKRKGEDE